MMTSRNRGNLSSITIPEASQQINEADGGDTPDGQPLGLTHRRVDKRRLPTTPQPQQPKGIVFLAEKWRDDFIGGWWRTTGGCAPPSPRRADSQPPWPVAALVPRLAPARRWEDA